MSVMLWQTTMHYDMQWQSATTYRDDMLHHIVVVCRHTLLPHVPAHRSMSWHIATLTTMYWDMQQAECDDILRRYVAHAAYRRGMLSHSAYCMFQYIVAWHSMPWHIATHQSTS